MPWLRSGRRTRWSIQTAAISICGSAGIRTRCTISLPARDSHQLRRSSTTARRGHCAYAGLSDEAVQYGEAIRLAPNDSIPVLSRAEVYLQLGRYAEAVADYDRAIALGLRHDMDRFFVLFRPRLFQHHNGRFVRPFSDMTPRWRCGRRGRAVVWRGYARERLGRAHRRARRLRGGAADEPNDDWILFQRAADAFVNPATARPSSRRIMRTPCTCSDFAGSDIRGSDLTSVPACRYRPQVPPASIQRLDLDDRGAVIAAGPELPAWSDCRRRRGGYWSCSAADIRRTRRSWDRAARRGR